eukprot:10800307-Prorocentrum_lima.AAC.1
MAAARAGMTRASSRSGRLGRWHPVIDNKTPVVVLIEVASMDRQALVEWIDDLIRAVADKVLTEQDFLLSLIHI